MPKLRPERISGIVALSYLVLIPVGAFVIYRKVQIIDQDVTAMWDRMDPKVRPDHEAIVKPFIDVKSLFGGITRNG